LKALVTPKNDVGLEIQRRTQTANICFCDMRKHLQSSHLARHTKLTIYKTLIHPVLLYGIETWLLRKRKNGLYMSRYNFELDREFKSPNVMGIVKNNKLRFAAHMIREDLLQRALFRAMPEDRRNQGRPKSRWANVVNKDSRALGARDWTNFARDRVQGGIFSDRF
jgi:hypothetical protein